MSKPALALVFAAAVLLGSAAATNKYVTPCTAAGTVEVVPDTHDPTEFGCDGKYQYGNNMKRVYNLHTSSEHYYLQLETLDTEKNLDTVTVACGDTAFFGPFSGQGSALQSELLVVEIPAGCDAVATFSTDRSNSGAGFVMTIVPKEAVVGSLVQPYTLSRTIGQPGFVYFNLTGLQQLGKELSLDLNVFEYDGLRPPALYVRENHFPTLDYPGTQVGSARGNDGGAKGHLALQNPPAGQYFAAVFLYGPSAHFEIGSNWTVSTDQVPVITSGQFVNASVTPGATSWFQLEPQQGRTSILFEVSRDAGGSPPEVVICTGLLCEAYDPFYYVGLMSTESSTYDKQEETNVNDGYYYLGFRSTGADRASGVLRATVKTRY